MEHTKKMVLVPESTLNQVTNQNHMLNANQSYVSDLDTQMMAILQDKNMPDDLKAKHYNQALHRFLGFRKHELDQSVKVSVASATVLPSVHVQSVANDDLSELVATIPKQSNNKARMLLDHLKRNPDIKWNERQELIYKGTVVPDSNIQDLVSIFLRPFKKKQDNTLKGWREFGTGLLDNNVPRTAIVNKNLLENVNKISDDDDDEVFQDAQVTPTHVPPMKRPRVTTPQQSTTPRQPTSGRTFTRSDLKKASPNTQETWRTWR
jgi:hypothetical protein